MLVYGDPWQIEAVAEKVGRIRAGLVAAASDPPGISRHARLASLLIEAGELAQGLLDERLLREGTEQPGEVGERAGNLCLSLAEALLHSLAHGFQHEALVNEQVQRCLGALLSLDLPAAIEVRLPEGYAFYGLYPECYLAAGDLWRAELPADLGARAPVHVVGIRSIGTSLAAAVAAAPAARSVRAVVPADRRHPEHPPVTRGPGGSQRSAPAEGSLPATGSTEGAAWIDLLTVRPQGHPFDRRLDLPTRTASRLLAPPGTRYAIVDEGPGLSGSSFGSVADWLEDHGVSREALAFFPSHRNPLGPQARKRHRERWERVRRLTVDFEELFLGDPGSPLHLTRWAEDLTGPATAPLEDLGAGRWRTLHFPSDARWPPVHTQGERRKFLLTSARGRWLLKFVGLGRYGEEALARAVILEGAGLIPPVAGLRHGFLVGPWLGGARPLPLVPHLDRNHLLDSVSRHLAFLADRFPAPPGRAGATPTHLLAMAEHNAAQVLGAAEAEPLRAWREHLPKLDALVRPVLSDNRLHAWEWLVTADGRLLKADALDHHRSNDLVGPQDPAWDLAAAMIELELQDDETEALADRFARRSNRRPPSPRHLAFYTLAYLAFETGRLTLAADALAASDPSETSRLRETARHRASQLHTALHRQPAMLAAR